jgi:hypothetical protein
MQSDGAAVVKQSFNAYRSYDGNDCLGVPPQKGVLEKHICFISIFPFVGNVARQTLCFRADASFTSPAPTIYLYLLFGLLLVLCLRPTPKPAQIS